MACISSAPIALSNYEPDSIKNLSFKTEAIEKEKFLEDFFKNKSNINLSPLFSTPKKTSSLFKEVFLKKNKEALVKNEKPTSGAKKEHSILQKLFKEKKGKVLFHFYSVFIF
jgi:hypothetical protein